MDLFPSNTVFGSEKSQSPYASTLIHSLFSIWTLILSNSEMAVNWGTWYSFKWIICNEKYSSWLKTWLFCVCFHTMQMPHLPQAGSSLTNSVYTSQGVQLKSGLDTWLTGSLLPSCSCDGVTFRKQMTISECKKPSSRLNSVKIKSKDDLGKARKTNKPLPFRVFLTCIWLL